MLRESYSTYLILYIAKLSLRVTSFRSLHKALPCTFNMPCAS